MEGIKTERLGSLDVLRGFDLFCLVFFQPVLVTLGGAMDAPWMNGILRPFSHVQWEGFAFWDIIMPLFMFMAGVSMPFAFSKHIRTGTRKQLYKRVLKRALLLWLFGMMCQGNLLALDTQKIFFFSNTLQAIAIGYLISAVLLIHFRQRIQILITAGLLVLYWVLLTFVSVDGFGGGNFSPDHNLAEYVDRIVLGRFRDGSVATPEGIDFGSYRYTWLVSSLNFGVTVMSGVFAGQVLKENYSNLKKLKLLLIIGSVMIIAGVSWSFQMPIIKKIWTSSMTLFSSGICFLLMALFYYLVDYKNGGKHLNWMKIYGMNSILAYMLYEIVDFSSIFRSVFHGTEQFLGVYYPALIKLSNVSVIFFILYMMYRKGKFLKV